MGRRILAANWKMHHGPRAARAFLERFIARVAPADGRQLWFFPPAASMQVAASISADRGDISVGAQNVHWEAKGAFTGEMSTAIAVEAGARGGLVGHSERRHVFGETDDETRRKTAALLAAGLQVMLCVGEKLDEREAGRTESIVLRQLDAALANLPGFDAGQLMIAYEPVWAIGTGRNATPTDASSVHAVIRERLRELGGSAEIPILYGGSVNTGNAAALLSEPGIDGVLVGGASLDADGWAAIVESGPALR